MKNIMILLIVLILAQNTLAQEEYYTLETDDFEVKMTPTVQMVSRGEVAEYTGHITDNRKDCDNGEPVLVHDTLWETESKDYESAGRTYNILNAYAENDDGVECAKLAVNGEITPCLEEGESTKLNNGDKISIRRIMTSGENGLADFELMPKKIDKCLPRLYDVEFRQSYGETRKIQKETMPGETITWPIKVQTSSIQALDGGAAIYVRSNDVMKPATVKVQLHTESYDEHQSQDNNAQDTASEIVDVSTDTEEDKDTDSAETQETKTEETKNPPAFPESDTSISISLKTGWNLISLPGTLIRFEGLSGGNKLIGFIYYEKKYYSMQDAKELLGSGFNTYLGKNAFWVYSYEDQYLNVEYARDNTVISIDEGWNLLPIRYEFLGMTLNDLGRSCQLMSAYRWTGKSWVRIRLEEEFSKDDLGKGFILRSRNACTLSIGLTPPPMPDEIRKEIEIKRVWSEKDPLNQGYYVVYSEILKQDGTRLRMDEGKVTYTYESDQGIDGSGGVAINSQNRDYLSKGYYGLGFGHCGEYEFTVRAEYAGAVDEVKKTFNFYCANDGS